MKDEDGNSDKHMYIKESGIVHRKIYIYIYIYILVEENIIRTKGHCVVRCMSNSSAFRDPNRGIRASTTTRILVFCDQCFSDDQKIITIRHTLVTIIYGHR